MRLFLSINFDEKTKERFQQIQDRMRKLGSGRFTPPENFHMTLVFFGEMPEELVPIICTAMRSIKISKTQIKFAQIGCFSEAKKLWWTGIEGNRQLNDLQQRIVEKLDQMGIWYEKERFFPHVTLVRNYCRGKGFDKRKAFGQPFVCRVNSFSLMESKLGENGPVYNEIERFGKNANEYNC